MTGDDCPFDRCWECWQLSPHQTQRNVPLMDLETGRRYCYEHMAAYVTRELDRDLGIDVA